MMIEDLLWKNLLKVSEINRFIVYDALLVLKY